MLGRNGNINFLFFLYFSNPQYRQQMSPETMKKMEKEKFYLEQKQKLKQFHTQSVDPNKLIESMFGKTEKPKVKQDTTGL
jgi:flagellar biosynthesis protein FliP